MSPQPCPCRDDLVDGTAVPAQRSSGGGFRWMPPDPRPRHARAAAGRVVYDPADIDSWVAVQPVHIPGQVRLAFCTRVDLVVEPRAALIATLLDACPEFRSATVPDAGAAGPGGEHLPLRVDVSPTPGVTDVQARLAAASVLYALATGAGPVAGLSPA